MRVLRFEMDVRGAGGDEKECVGANAGLHEAKVIAARRHATRVPNVENLGQLVVQIIDWNFILKTPPKKTKSQ